MKKHVIIALIPVFLLNSMSLNVDLITDMQKRNSGALIQEFLTSSGNFSMDETIRFFLQLKIEMQGRYGIDVDLEKIIEEAIQTLVATGKFLPGEIQMARTFYSQITECIKETEDVEEVLCNRKSDGKEKSNGLKFWRKKKKKNKKHKQCNTPELELPGRLAIGFACVLAGSLLCIVPVGQVYGAELILIGGAFVFEGLAEGEKPYYIESTTGQRTDAPNPNGG